MSEKPRKRKDKKKKDSVSDAAEIARRLSTKEDSDAGDSATSHPSGVQSMGPDDVQLHVHKDHGTGGHWCAKIVFFSLMAILAGLVGLIILENRGLSDVDTPLSESRFSEILEGWVDENRESHDDHDHEILASLEELDEHDEHGEPFEEEEDHDQEDEDHDQEDDEHDEEDEEEEDHGDEEDDEDQANEDEEEDQVDEEDEDDGEANEDEDQEDQDQNVDDNFSEELPNDDDDQNYQEDDDNAYEDENQTNEDNDENENDDNNDNEDDNDDDDDNQRDNDEDDDAPFEEHFTTNKSIPVPLTQTSDITEKTDTVTVADLEVQIEAMKIAYDEVAQQLGKPSFSELKDATQECPVEDFSYDERIKLDDDGSFEEVIDNDAGEDLHVQKLAQKDQPEPEEDDDDQLASPSSSQIPPRSGAQSFEDDLQRANDDLDDNPRSALNAFDKILKDFPQTPEALYGRARALDRMSEMQQSNAILKDAIRAYEAVVRLKMNVSDDLFTAAATRCIDRMRFLGLHSQAMPIHEALIHRFDDQPEYRNQLAISYLLLNQLADAKFVLHHTLLRWRDNPIALVHYGFVLKALDQDYEDAALYLSEGLASNAEGTQDGRFYFALGDSLMRLGRRDKARAIFRLGAKKKLFLSEYQRSLYNVDNLKSKPFWTIDETKNRKLFETLELNWKLIRDEGMKLLDQEGFFVDEAENLREKGDWKQFDLFVKGQKITKHCQKAPLTCNIMESFPAARFCTRGQIKFSVMHPGTHVWPHCGPTNCRIRAHLGLKVPPATFIRVAEETRSWHEGKVLIFDDSFEHEVWHNGTEVRLVLIVDIWHPDLSEDQRRSLHPI